MTYMLSRNQGAQLSYTLDRNLSNWKLFLDKVNTFLPETFMSNKIIK